MKKEIRLKYSWIKQRRKDVLEFLEENYWIEKNTTSKTQIESGLGITGDDAAELIQKFEQHFHVDMSGLNFATYFYDEAVGLNPFPALFLQKLVLFPFVLLVLPFSYSKFKEILFYNPTDDYIIEKKPLTIGDLITSSFTHKFTLQKDVIIKLV